MEYRELFSQAVQSLRTNVLRTGLTMLGIIIGISSVILIVSIGQGAVAFITNELSSFGTDYFQIRPGNSPISSFAGGVTTLTTEDVDAIRDDKSITNINKVAAMTIAQVVVSSNEVDKRITVYGATIDSYDILKPEITKGEFISEEHELDSARVAVVGPDVVTTFFGVDADPVGQKIRIDNKTFRIVGVSSSSSALAGGFLNNSIFIPLSVSLNQIEGNVDIAEIDVSVKNTDIINDTINQVETLLRDRHNLDLQDENDFRIASATDLISSVQTITSLLTLVIAAISGISLVVGGVGVMNIMLVSVTERTKEIGLLKSIGALEKDILTQFLIESVVMTSIGGIIGILIGIGGAFLISIFVKIPFVISLPAVLIAVGVSGIVGIVFGLYPARRAARLSPIDALRYE